MSNGDDDDARANDGADDAKATGDATGDANAGDGDNRRTARDGARATREGDDGEDARPRGKRPDISNLVSVKIDNVSYELREEDLRAAFEKFGDVGDVYIPKERGSYRARGFAFVRYRSREHAEAAVSAMHETELGGRQIRAAVAERGRPEGGYQANNNRGRYEARRPYDDDRRRDDYRDRRRDGDGYRRDDYRRDDYRRDDYRRDDYRRDDYRRDDYQQTVATTTETVATTTEIDATITEIDDEKITEIDAMIADGALTRVTMTDVATTTIEDVTIDTTGVGTLARLRRRRRANESLSRTKSTQIINTNQTRC